MDSLLEKRLEEARKGRMYLLDLQRKYNLDFSSYVLLIPDKENIVHLKKRFIQYIAIKHGNKGLILADNEMSEMAGKFQGSSLYIETCTSEQAENLIRFYCMYQFTSNLLVASLEKPDGRRGEKLVGIKGLDREEILDMVVFGIEKEQKAEETGNGI